MTKRIRKKKKPKKKSMFGADPWLRNARKDDLRDEEL